MKKLSRKQLRSLVMTEAGRWMSTPQRRHPRTFNAPPPDPAVDIDMDTDVEDVPPEFEEDYGAELGGGMSSKDYYAALRKQWEEETAPEPDPHAAFYHEKHKSPGMFSGPITEDKEEYLKSPDIPKGKKSDYWYLGSVNDEYKHDDYWANIGWNDEEKEEDPD